MRKITLIAIAALFYSTAVTSQTIEEFLASESRYVEVLKDRVSSLYDRKPSLVVIEFSVKRDPTGFEAENELYIYLKALDKNDITEISDETTRNAMKSAGLDAQEISVYTGVFSIPRGNLKPEVLSIGNSRSPLNNKWAELVQP